MRRIACLAAALGFGVLLLPSLAAAQAAPTPEGGSQSQSAPAAAPDTPPVSEDYALHGQFTFTEQFHPGFHAAYSGPQSLDSGRRGDETIDLTIFAGVRPWRGAEIWANPEVDQGFGLSSTLGIAAFPSAEAYKVGAASPYPRLQRLFLRQTIDLGGATQAIAPDLNQLGGSQTADRLVATIGKFSVGDVFDTNRYAHDPRNDFLNWANVDGGAFDYAADAWGYTYGAAGEWYQSWWTLRAGIFDGSVAPNSKALELPLGRQLQIITEAEARYPLFHQTGKLKLLTFLTRARLATFAELERFFAANPDATQADVASIRRLRSKEGIELNLEQPITDDLGAFLRASLSDGRTEVYDFADIDRSLSTGLSLAGKSWGRGDDTVGLALEVANISKARKEYLAQGGLGVLIGDGKLLNAGPEQVLETYYDYAVRSGVNLTVDYQLVNHPAYNVDRGPVHVFGVRAHVQF